MKKIVDYAKMSKRKRRQLDGAKRGTWGDIKPVTRRSENPRVYNRKRQRASDDSAGVYFCGVHGLQMHYAPFKISAKVSYARRNCRNLCRTHPLLPFSSFT